MTSTQWVEYHVGTKRKSYNTLPTSNITAETVTVDGFTLSQTDNAGVTTTHSRSYTANGMILTRTDGRGNTTTTVTDKAGRMLTVTDAAGMKISKTYADSTSVVKTYNAYNRVLTETDARGKVKAHTYEQARGLLLGTSYNDSTSPRAYTYNHLGQRTQVTDAAGVRILSYNAYGEQESDSLIADNVTHLITETRDTLGRSTGYTYAKNGSVQQTVTTGYGSDGRIVSAGFLHGGEAKQFSYEYLSGTHLLEKLTKPNGMTLTQSYEILRDLLTGMAYHRGSTLVAQREYVYDTLGRPTARNTSRQGTVKNDTFGYNNRSELTSATVNGNNYAYDYDNIGNRNTAQEVTEEIANYTANNLNQYTTVGDFTPTFDADGNQTLVKTSTGTWEVTYDAENRPVSFTNEETNTVIECAYDHMGRRATKKVTVDGGITLHQRYLYRGYLQIACCDLTRSNHPALWFITWNPTQPIATRPLAIQKDGTWYTYGWDLTKNVCEIYGTNGYIRTSYTYTPYGSVTESSNSIYQPIQWSSEYNDTELGLVYYNYRHYNPMDGRWIGRDREEKGSNLYLFSKNNTPRYLDHLGNVFVRPSHSTSGIPGAQQEHIKPLPPPKPKNGCLISICCRHPYFVPGIMRAHCIIRFLYNSGTVKGCRGGPSGDGPSNPKTNRKNGNPPNNQSPHCNGCCGSFGNVIAGCGEITTPKGEDDKLQIGLNIDLEVAEQDHNRCVTAKDTTVEDCNRIYECMKKKMDEITNACYIYSSLGNNSNTSWQTAYKSCIGELINPMGNQPGHKNFDTNKKCKTNHEQKNTMFFSYIFIIIFFSV